MIESQGAGDLHAFGLSPRRRARRSSPRSWSRPSAGSAPPGPTPTTRGPTSSPRPRRGSRSPRDARSTSPCGAPRSPRSCSVGHTAALGALVGHAPRPGVGRRRARRLRRVRGARQHPGPRVSATSGGSTPITTRCCSPPTRPTRCCPTGVFPCADGYVSMMSTPQQLKEMLEVLDDDALKEAFARPDAFSNPETKEILDTALYPWLFEHTRAEATALAQAAQWPLAGVYIAGRGDAGRPLLPARVLGRLRRSRPRASAPPRPAVPPRRGRVAAPPPRPRAARARRRASRCAANDPPPAATRERRRPTAARHPGPRLHDRVVGPVPHAAARRPRRRGDPGREPVGVPAHHQGLPRRVPIRTCCSGACSRCTRPRSTTSTTVRTTATR